MGDNQEQQEAVVSPTTSDVDLSPVIDKLNDLVVKQGEIIQQQQKIIDYFVPTEKEIKEQELQEKKKIEEQKKETEQLLKVQEEEQKEKELKEIQELDFQTEVTHLLNQINDSQVVGNEVSAVSSSSNYTLLFIIISIVFFGVMYKAIRAFI